MTQKKIKRIIRPATAEERRRHAEIRQEVLRDYPPSPRGGRRESPPGIATEIRLARESQGLTWYALAKLAGIPNPNTVRDIEYGRDAQLSNVQAVAEALGLRLEVAIK
jgi:ribosome-binding protein aMBF1 (putative translation factor)